MKDIDIITGDMIINCNVKDLDRDSCTLVDMFYKHAKSKVALALTYDEKEAIRGLLLFCAEVSNALENDDTCIVKRKE